MYLASCWRIRVLYGEHGAAHTEGTEPVFITVLLLSLCLQSLELPGRGYCPTGVNALDSCCKWRGAWVVCI